MDKLILPVATLFILTPLPAHASIWSVDIDESPAPSPEDGPPFSAHASRDPALLPAQICGIVGAYLASAFILGSLLLTVGRRMRRKAQSTPVIVSTEMVKPILKMFDESPISPGSQRSWYSPRRLKKKRSMPGSTRSVSNPGSPAVESVASFDVSVIEADKAARQQQLEQLYAAALAQEAAKSRSTVAEKEIPSPAPSPSKQRKPPRLLTSAPALSHLNTHGYQASPVSPRSPIRAIYPPSSSHYNMPSPHYQVPSPVSPMPIDYPINQPSTSTRTRTPSFGSQGEVRHPRRSRRSLRLHQTSVNRYPGEVSDEEVRTPLTPRYYTDPGVPPSPPPRSEAPTTPGTHDGWDNPADIEEMDRIRAVPRADPQRASSQAYPSAPMNLHLNTHTRRSGASAGASSASTLGALPFRTMNTTDHALPSPGPSTKVTYLERRRDGFGAMRTGLATPYSPYMPFTPLTPVTPHLTSRAERRQREREGRRRAQAEEDRVVEEGEMWGSGY